MITAQVILGHYDKFSGMENITATTYADSEILHADYPDTDAENLVTHELAHSWFGNLVTCKSWAHLWLNQGFATFFEAGFRSDSQAARLIWKRCANTRRIFWRRPFGKTSPALQHKLSGWDVALRQYDLSKRRARRTHAARDCGRRDFLESPQRLFKRVCKFSNVESRDLQRTFERVSGRSLNGYSINGFTRRAIQSCASARLIIRLAATDLERHANAEPGFSQHARSLSASG